jgi:two-component sensor histidine kinase
MLPTPDLEWDLGIGERESRFESLFEQVTIPLFEEDFSAVMTRLAPLAEAGRLDEALLLADDRALARECAGLALGEMVSNSLRHAFKGRKAGQHPPTPRRRKAVSQ